MESVSDERELEALIEAQARGEQVEGIRAEEESEQDAELDSRASKGSGVLVVGGQDPDGVNLQGFVVN